MATTTTKRVIAAPSGGSTSRVATSGASGGVAASIGSDTWGNSWGFTSPTQPGKAWGQTWFSGALATEGSGASPAILATARVRARFLLLLIEGDEQSNGDRLLLEGDMETGDGDALRIEGDEARISGTKRVTL